MSHPTVKTARSTFRSLALALMMAPLCLTSAQAETALPKDVPVGTTLVVADQNEVVQTLLKASGEQDKLSAEVTYANFLGGPAILEAFRAGALDVASVGNTPPIQAQASGEKIPIVAALAGSEPDYDFAVRPGLKVTSFAEFKGKKIAYAEGTGRQPFVLQALKFGGLTRDDVELVPLRVSDFPDAIRNGQVDLAPLTEPHFSRYLAEGDRESKVLPKAEQDKLPRSLSYLYASGAALKDPAKTAAVRDFVEHYIAAKKWSKANPDAWVDAYYVKGQKLTKAEGDALVAAEGKISFPQLSTLIERQQGLIDIIVEAGDIPKRLEAADEFDLRFDEVLATASN
jgi:sulfonate transport system substrate-binding protein